MTDEEIRKIYDAHTTLHEDDECSYWTVDYIAFARALLAAGASEGQAEPVAYMRTYRAYRDDQSAAPDPGVMVTSFHQNHEYAKQCPGENTPLYAHPSAEIAALRERIAGMEKDAVTVKAIDLISQAIYSGKTNEAYKRLDDIRAVLIAKERS